MPVFGTYSVSPVRWSSKYGPWFWYVTLNENTQSPSAICDSVRAAISENSTSSIAIPSQSDEKWFSANQ